MINSNDELFHILTVKSQLPLTIFELGKIAKAETVSVCPFKVAINLNEVIFHSLIVVSWLQLTKFELVIKANPKTELLWPFKIAINSYGSFDFHILIVLSKLPVIIIFDELGRIANA